MVGGRPLDKMEKTPPTEPAAAWHSLALPATERLTRARPGGLTAREAAERGAAQNRITVQSRRGLPRTIAAQFVDPLVLVLLAAAAVSAVVTGELVQATVILVLVGVNATLGASQEWRAARSLDALQRRATHSATAIRDGRQVRIPASDLVVGDIVVLASGDRVPADIRLIETPGLEVDESALSGESRMVPKDPRAVPAGTALADRTCMAYSSTFVRRGRGRGIVVAIGDATEFGRIARLTGTATRPATPLQRQLARLGVFAGIAVGILTTLLVVVGVLQGRQLLDVVLLGVALAVSAIPEGLVAIAAIVLARGVRRMAERGAIIRTLPTVETLGAVDVMCVDKTGTLTENRMRVVEYWQPGSGEPTPELLRAAAFCGDASGSPDADPLEIALFEWATARGARGTAREAELGFDPARRLMSTAHLTGDGSLEVLTKGGLDEVLARCRPGAELSARARAAHETMARRGLRILAFARREIPADTLPARWEQDLTFLGLVALEDPPRASAAEAVDRAMGAGISVVMITGDHADTATAIADELGLRRGREVMTGAQVDGATDEELARRAPGIGVFARVAPETKMRIVRAFQARGSIVAMTGDGVNDGPALSTADVGCAMGRSGTDVARDAAGLVVTDDRVETIVDAVSEGRRTHDNLTKVVEFLLSTNAGELLLIVGSVLAGLASPLTPAQILIVNLLTDGGPALALAADPPSPRVMMRSPRRPALLTRRSILRIAYQGALFAAVAMLSFLAAGGVDDLGPARTSAFVTLAVSQVLHAFAVRTRGPAFASTTTRNPALVWVSIVTALVSIGIVYVPVLNTALTLHPLDARTMAVAIALALAPFGVVEVIKAVVRRATGHATSDRG